MFSLVEHIEYLICQYDCVVVPQLGAFIAQYETARFNETSVTAPARRISFNAQVNSNDGILAVSLMKRYGMSYDQAVGAIAREVAAVKKVLNADIDYPIGGIGYLTRGKASIEFTPFRSASISSDYFGLRSFNLTPVVSETSAQVTAPVKPKWKQALQWAASIIIILGLGFMLSTPIINDNHQQAGLNITTLKKPEAKTVVDKSHDAATTQTSEQEQEEKDYQLVVTTFMTEKAANEFVALHPAMNLTVVKYGKHYRILAAQSNSQQEILNLQKDLPANMPSWIAHK